MKTLALCVAFYGLGVFNCAVFAAVYLLHRPRYVAPTKRRKYRDAPERLGVLSLAGIEQLRPDNLRRAKEMQQSAEIGGIKYEHLGMTGLEE